MSGKDTFDPFDEADDVEADDTDNDHSNSMFADTAAFNTSGSGGDEYDEDLNQSSFDNSHNNLFDTTFDSTAFDFGAASMTSPNSTSIDFDLSGGMLKGATTASGGHHFPDMDTPTSAASGGSDGGSGDNNVDDDIFFSKLSSDNNKHEIPVKIAMHEEMSCVYDGVSRTSSLSIEGIVSVS